MGVQGVVLLLYFCFQAVHGNNNCEFSFCSHSSLIIRFPFRLPNQPLNCGYPGFDLSCNVEGRPVLNLPYSGSFLVRSINYQEQKIRLNDKDGCNLRRIFELNLSSSSPFKVAYYQNFTLLECPTDMSYYNQCPRNFTSHTVIASSDYDVKYLYNRCNITDTRSVAGHEPFESFILNDDLLLKWNVPNCMPCEERLSLCEFRNSTSQETHCIDTPTDSGSGSGNGSGDGRKRVRTILALIFLPIIILSTCYICCICTSNAATQTQTNASSQNSIPATNTSIVQASNLARALDNSTIQSYTTVKLGESLRISGPNSTTCPICLEDYLPEDILRCIPECDHCFHANCIDEWLRLKNICPVCRNSLAS